MSGSPSSDSQQPSSNAPSIVESRSSEESIIFSLCLPGPTMNRAAFEEPKNIKKRLALCKNTRPGCPPECKLASEALVLHDLYSLSDCYLLLNLFPKFQRSTDLVKGLFGTSCSSDHNCSIPQNPAKNSLTNLDSFDFC